MRGAPPPTDRTDRIALLASVAVGLAVRTVLLGRDDLWSDEVHTLHTMQVAPADVVGERLGAGHVPLYFLLLRAWTAVAGLSQFALRLPSALLGTALLVPSFVLFRRLLPAPAARWALAVAAVHPVFVEMSREARMYSLLGLAFVVAAEAAVAALDEGRLPWRFWAAVAAGPLVHPSWAFGAAPLAAWVFAESRRRDCDDRARRAARVAAAGAAASIALLLLLLLAATPQHQELARRPWTRELVVFAIRPFVGSDLRFVLAAGIGVALVGWVVCCARGVWEGDSRARRFAVWTAIGVPAASVASGVVGGVPWGPVRYVQLAGFGLCAVAATAALHSARVQASLRSDASARRADGRPWSLRTAARSVAEDPVGVPWLFASLLLLFVLRVREPRTAWSDAAAEIRAEAPEAPVLVDDDGARIVLSHYLGRPVEVARGPVPAGALHARLDSSAAQPFVRIEPR